MSLVVEHHVRALDAPHLCTAVSDGVIYRNGVPEITPTRKLRTADADYTPIDKSSTL